MIMTSRIPYNFNYKNINPEYDEPFMITIDVFDNYHFIKSVNIHTNKSSTFLSKRNNNNISFPTNIFFLFSHFVNKYKNNENDYDDAESTIFFNTNITEFPNKKQYQNFVLYSMENFYSKYIDTYDPTINFKIRTTP